MNKPVLFFLLAAVLALPARAADYTIDQGHPAASDANAGTADLPWLTLAKANASLTAGDTVHIKAGTYTGDPIAPQRSGSSPAARITYRNFGTDVVTIANSSRAGYAVLLDGNAYVTVQGLRFTDQDRFLYIRGGAHHNIVADCTFDGARLVGGQPATWAGSALHGSAQHNWIHHCRFGNYGSYDADDNSCVLDIGEESNPADQTRYNLLEQNVFFHGGHHVVGVYGMFNVIRGNSFHNEPWSMGTVDSDRGAVLYGDRNLSFSGSSENGGRNLFEGNRVGYSADPSDNIGASGMALNSSGNIVRLNAYFHNISAGLSMSLTSSYLQSIEGNRIYNNTFFNNGHNPYDPTDHMSSGIGLGIYSGSWVIAGNVLKNNLLFSHRVPFGEYNINTPSRTGLLAAQVIENNWDGDAQGDPLFVSASATPGDPTDPLLPDLHLQEESPCKDGGTFLTTVSSASGSGTSIVVDDAGYFTDGWGIVGVNGDLIQLFGTVQRARLSGVDYATGTLTLDRPLTWTQGQGVALAYEGAAPELGAYELGTPIGAGVPAAPRSLRVF